MNNKKAATKLLLLPRACLHSKVFVNFHVTAYTKIYVKKHCYDVDVNNFEGIPDQLKNMCTPILFHGEHFYKG
jgi:hypothetical protein